MSSNRSGGIRNVKDSVRGKVLGLPVNSKKVTRRVKPDQVSTYHMKVHERSEDKPTDPRLLLNRNTEPGDIEINSINKHGHYLIDYSIAHNKVAEMLQGDRRRLLGEFQSNLVSAATLAKLFKEGRYSQAQEFINSDSFKINDLSRLSASSWRHFLKTAPVEMIDLLAFKKFQNSIMLGEISVLSNTLLRRGRNSLRYLLPAVGELSKDIEFVDLPHQQLFNIKNMTLTSKVEPLDRNHLNIIDTAGAKWVHTRSRHSKWIKNFLEAYNGSSIRVMLPGFPAKPDSSSNLFQVSERGLFNSAVQINPEHILNILGGFIINVRKKPQNELEKISEKWPQSSLLFPFMEIEPEAIQKNVRSHVIKFSNKIGPNNDILTSASSVGVGEHGISELDIRENGNYVWDNARPNVHKPYRLAEESDLYTSSFPHPFIKATAFKYLKNIEPDSVRELENLGVVTLPRTISKQRKRDL